MSNSIKLFLITAVICSGMVMGLTIFAQESQADQEANLISTQDSQNEATQEIALDEAVSSQDLEVEDQNLLPDSPFYFLKNWLRKARIAITLDKVKKAELEQKYVNEKLVELKKLTEKNASAEMIEKATENYQKAVELVKERVEKIKEKAEENQNVGNFLDKFTKQQVLQEKILEKLEGQVPSSVIEKIKEARENHLERFKEVMMKLEDNKERIAERLKNAIESQEGSEFKDFKNLEILKRIEDKMPDEIKTQIQEKAEGKILENLKLKVEALSVEKQEVLKNYIDNISGDKEKQLEILENIKAGIKEEKVEIREKLNEVREKIIEKIINPTEIKSEQETRNCPEVDKPSCENGRIVVQSNEEGCAVNIKCINPSEIEKPIIGEKVPGACVTVWNPVCGKDGKTYSNDCFAKIANMEIAYKGICKEKECETDTDCPLVECPKATNSAVKCLEMKNKCVNGKCVEASLKVEAQ